MEPPKAAGPDEEELLEGDLVEDPKLRRTVEFYVKQDIEQHLHVGERAVLPEAAELERLEEVRPGLAEDVVGEWKTEGKFRREMDREVVKAQISGYKRYQNYVLILLLALIGTGTYLAAIGVGFLGFVLALSGIIPIVARALLGLTGGRSDGENDDSSDDEGNSDSSSPAGEET